MSRRFVISILIILILGIIGGTAMFIWQRLAGPSAPADTVTISDQAHLGPADVGQATVVDLTGDDDGDGLSNAEEVVWGVDPRNPDTDGDGYRDGDEVTAHHNPSIAGPNDKLPDNFDPKRDIQPLDAAPLQADQFFAENLDLEPLRERNLTAEYKKRYPENERTQGTLVTFAKEQTIVTRLPLVREDAIVVTKNNSALTLGHYLDVAGNLDSLMNRTVISDAFTDMFESDDVSTVYGLAVSARQFQEELKTVPVPPEAVQLHKLLLSISEVLVHTYTLIAHWEVDPAKSMVGIHQLDTLDQTYMPLIITEVARLEARQERSK